MPEKPQALQKLTFVLAQPWRTDREILNRICFVLWISQYWTVKMSLDMKAREGFSPLGLLQLYTT